jgi:hypothetical protein
MLGAVLNPAPPPRRTSCRRAPQLSSRAAATAVWALARLHKSSLLPQQELHATVCELMQQLQRRLPHCSPQDLSNSLWALAKLRVQPPQDWLQDWVAASAGMLGQFSGQAIGNAVWGLVKLGHRPGEAWVQRCLTAMHYLPQEQASEQDWSTLQVRHPDLWPHGLPNPAPARSCQHQPARAPGRAAPAALPPLPSKPTS